MSAMFNNYAIFLYLIFAASWTKSTLTDRVLEDFP